MQKTTKTKVPHEVEVRPIVVKPAEFKKLQADVVVLEKDSVDKQKIIDKLRADVTSQETRIADLEGVVNP